jgi:hypothetical protein
MRAKMTEMNDLAGQLGIDPAARPSKSVRVDMLRAEVDRSAKTLDEIARAREMLEIELRSPPRVTLLSLAEVPQEPCNSEVRYALTGLATLACLCLPVATVIGFRLVRRAVKLVERLQQIGPVVGLTERRRRPAIGPAARDEVSRLPPAWENLLPGSPDWHPNYTNARISCAAARAALTAGMLPPHSFSSANAALTSGMPSPRLDTTARAALRRVLVLALMFATWFGLTLMPPFASASETSLFGAP